MDNLKIFADEIQQGNLQLGWYKKGRVAIIQQDTTLINALKDNPEQSADGEKAFKLFSWLSDKPRLVGKIKKPMY
ncbi:hypothetical protein LHK12_18290 [Providencia rettgeri]|nr:hypothetical protein [Providencia rettgeri]